MDNLPSRRRHLKRRRNDEESDDTEKELEKLNASVKQRRTHGRGKPKKKKWAEDDVVREHDVMMMRRSYRMMLMRQSYQMMLMMMMMSIMCNLKFSPNLSFILIFNQRSNRCNLKLFDQWYLMLMN